MVVTVGKGAARMTTWRRTGVNDPAEPDLIGAPAGRTSPRDVPKRLDLFQSATAAIGNTLASEVTIASLPVSRAASGFRGVR